MGIQWYKIGKGLQARDHESRKYGRRFDRFIRCRYMVDGKFKIIPFGWESDFAITEKARIESEGGGIGKRSLVEHATAELETLRMNAKAGSGPTTKKEAKTLALEKAREEAEAKAKAEAEAKEEEEKNISFADFFESEYWPVAVSSKKKESYRKEREHFKNWIEPVVGDMAFKNIFQLDVERIKRKMQKEKKSPRSIEYVMATFRQVWNLARTAGLTTVDSPSKAVKIHKPDNNRDRYLTDDEAESLLQALKKKSEQVYQISLVSLDTGGRFSEVARLSWGNVDLDRGVIHYRDAKMAGGTKSRVVPMPDRVKELFQGMEIGEKGELIFPDKKGLIQEKISHTFYRCVKDEKLNEGIEDPRQKIVFHSMRHSYASRLVQSGVDLYVVQRLLGHSISKMTERYSHLSSDTLLNAVRQMEQAERNRKERAGKVVKLPVNR